MTNARLLRLFGQIRELPCLPPLIGLVGVLTLVALWQLIVGDPALAQAQWERASIASGAWWRLITGHLVHLNSVHGLMNIAAAGLIMALVGGASRVRGWLMVWLLISLAVSLALYFRDASLGFYAGASGVLHGLVSFGALRQWRTHRTESAVLIGGLVAKLVWEQWSGATAGTAQLIGAPVIINAHLYGALAGALIAAFFATGGGRQQVRRAA